MDEDYSELTEASYARDYAKMYWSLHSTHFKQFKCHQIADDDEYGYYNSRFFDNFALSYPRADEMFDLFKLPDTVFDRFVQLLSTLTLHHFSLSSKAICYHSLDLRGFEYDTIRMDYRNTPSTGLIAYSGMKKGCIGVEHLSNYQILFTTLFIFMPTFFDHPKRMNFLKKYKHLIILFKDTLFDVKLTEFCDAVFHPGIEHVVTTINFIEGVNVYLSVSVEKVFQFLDYCKNVKHLVVRFSDGVRQVRFINNPPFSTIKNALEQWAGQAPNLETFMFSYKQIMFQWHEKRLKRVVKYGGKWYWSNRCDIDNENYKIYDHFKIDISRIPVYQLRSYFDDTSEIVDQLASV